MKPVLKTHRLLAVAMTVAATVMFAFSALAQPPGGAQRSPEERAKMQTDQMKEKLELTDAQYKSVYEINLKYAQKTREMMQNRTGDRDAMMKQFQAQQEAKDGEVKGVLTPDQFKQYAADEQQMRARMQSRGR